MTIPDNAVAFAPAINDIRRAMADANIPAKFEIMLTASGRVNDGEVKIEWSVSAGGFDNWQGAKGDSLSACVAEVLHRHGWQARHAPVRIGHEPARVTVG
jgi:hypothetical protein